MGDGSELDDKIDTAVFYFLMRVEVVSQNYIEPSLHLDDF